MNKTAKYSNNAVVNVATPSQSGQNNWVFSRYLPLDMSV